MYVNDDMLRYVLMIVMAKAVRGRRMVLIRHGWMDMVKARMNSISKYGKLLLSFVKNIMPRNTPYPINTSTI